MVIIVTYGCNWISTTSHSHDEFSLFEDDTLIVHTYKVKAVSKLI
jgi:hypothetical protein